MTVPLPLHRQAVSGRALARLRTWVAEVEAWPVGSHRWGHYYEETAAGAVPCRTENVSACHDGVRRLVEGVLGDIAADAATAAVADFKDKVNYKHPGGGGFGPHQDLPAYPGAPEVVSVLVALDACTEVSGCLWLAPEVSEPLPTDQRGTIDPAVASSLEWVPVDMHPGDALVLHGLAPHFSRANTGSQPRRVLVASYAPVGARYSRDRYYRERRASMLRSAAAGGTTRISTIDDFEGRRTSGDGHPSATACTHG
ncbi:MAG TPA: phytanoyl-CoA dioxygenase family protein [Acidimicrobiales bacterium]|nr:phytanoyl-CoA dioxygenase family protein [Acidimicrobiales bacterium]